MPLTVADRDLGDLIQSLTTRVRNLEQRGTVAALTALPTDPHFNSVTVDSHLLDTPSDPATGLVATPGVFLDNIFIDVSWTLSATANEYQVELAEKIAGVYQAPTQHRTSGTNIRIEGLMPDTIYGVRVYAINRLGLSSVAEPAAGFTDVSTGHDSTTPTALTGLVVSAGFRSLVAVWNDTTDFDFDYYNLQLATDAGFTTGVRVSVVRGSIGGWTDLAPNTTYWVRVQAVDQSGNLGPWTAGASVTTQRVGDGSAGEIAPLYIDSAVIATAAILTAKIGDLQVTNAKVNDAIIDKITAGTIASKDYILGAGGQLKTTALAPGFVMNSQGISFYNSSGVRTIFLDAATGAGTFYGAISSGTTITAPVITAGTIIGTLFATAASGKRIEMGGSGLLANDITMYTGTVQAEIDPASVNVDFIFTGTATQGRLNLVSPNHETGGFQAFVQLIGPSDSGSDSRIDMTAENIELGAVTVHINGASLVGDYDGSGAVAVEARSGNMITAAWDDTDSDHRGLSFWVDTVEADKIFIPGTDSGRSGLHGDWGGWGGGLRTRDVDAAIFNVGWDPTAVGALRMSLNVDDTFVKNFIIPHPLDEERLLVHACVEGPTADVFYRGRGLLGLFGSAVVTLPDYFEALTLLDGRTVQVTPIGGAYSLAVSDVVDGKFTVFGPRSLRVPFFWRVDAVRKNTKFEVEPLKSETTIKGQGPYTYIGEK